MEFRILGPLEVTRKGQLLALGGAKQRALLAILLTEPNKVLAVDRLAILLWGEDPPATAAHAIEVYVSELRKMLEPEGAPYKTLLTSPAGYSIRVEVGELDAMEFQNLVLAAEQLSPEQALVQLDRAFALWRGPAFADFAAEQFAVSEAARLNELHLHATEQRINAELALGMHALLIPELLSLVREHPVRERLAGQLMLALYRSGRQAEASDVYQSLRDRLVEEQGMEPGPELQALLKRILQQDASLAPPNGRRRNNLPRPLSSLVGRAQEITATADLIEAARLVTITGAGGIGKTRLAVEVARMAEGRFPDGAWMVELAAVPDGESVAPAIVHALELRQAGADTAREQLVKFLADREALLVLDNCEHVVEATAGLAAHLLSRAFGLRILATSREPLGVPGERLIRLAPLPVLRGAGSRSEAVELLLQRCQDLDARELGEDEVSYGVAICERLDGIPLAIELAAAQTTVLSLSEIALKLDDRFSLLASPMRTVLPRQQTLKATVDWSYRLLRPEEQVAFRRFGAFPAEFDLDAAAAALEASDAAAKPIVGIVGSLIRKSMLTARDQASGRRYQMLDTLRHFARERLDDAREAKLARDHHADHYFDLARSAFSRLRSAESDVWVRRLDVERDNLNAALMWLSSTRHEAFVRMVAALGRYWIRGRVRDGYDWTARAIKLGQDSPETQLDLLELWAWLTWQCDQMEPAFEAVDRMLKGATKARDDVHIGWALCLGSTFRSDRGMPVKPDDWRVAEAHLRRGGDDWALALLLNNRGFIRVLAGEPEQGLAQILEALELARQVGDGWLVALVLDSAAWTHADLGNPGEARTLWADGIVKVLSAADRWALPNYLEGFARVARLEGDAARSCTLLGAAAGVRNEMGAHAPSSWAAYVNKEIEILRRLVGPDMERCWQVGLHMSADEAAAFALVDPGGVSGA